MSFLSHKRKKAQPKRPSGHAAEEALRPGTTASACTKRMPWRPASPLRAEAAACHRFLLAAAFPSPSDEPSGLLFFLHVRAFHFSRRRCPRAADRLSHQGRLCRGGSRCSQSLRPQARTLPEPDTHTPHRPAQARRGVTQPGFASSSLSLPRHPLITSVKSTFAFSL